MEVGGLEKIADKFCYLGQNMSESDKGDWRIIESNFHCGNPFQKMVSDYEEWRIWERWVY